MRPDAMPGTLNRRTWFQYDHAEQAHAGLPATSAQPAPAGGSDQAQASQSNSSVSTAGQDHGPPPFLLIQYPGEGPKQHLVIATTCDIEARTYDTSAEGLSKYEASLMRDMDEIAQERRIGQGALARHKEALRRYVQGIAREERIDENALGRLQETLRSEFEEIGRSQDGPAENQGSGPYVDMMGTVGAQFQPLMPPRHILPNRVAEFPRRLPGPGPDEEPDWGEDLWQQQPQGRSICHVVGYVAAVLTATAIIGTTAAHYITSARATQDPNP